MSIRRNKGSGIYAIDISTPGGGRIRCSAETKDRKEAQEYHDRLKTEAWRVAKLGEAPRRTFEEAAMRFLREQVGTPDYENKERNIAHFGRTFAGRKLDSLTRDEIMNALPQMSSRPKSEKMLTNGTRNRYLATIRAMLYEAAGAWEWIPKAPKLDDLPEPTKRIRWIRREEAHNLIEAIRTDWLRDVAVFALSTGLRQGNIFGLEWSQVDLVRKRAWIHPDQTKSGKPLGVPLNHEAVSVIRRQLGKHQTLVFVRGGERIPCLDSAQWARACERAEIADFRFHDLRHTWASWHVQSGTSLDRLMELGGWATYDMVLRYAHLAPDHLADRANLVTIWKPTPDSNHVKITSNHVTEFSEDVPKKAG